VIKQNPSWVGIGVGFFFQNPLLGWILGGFSSKIPSWEGWGGFFFQNPLLGGVWGGFKNL